MPMLLDLLQKARHASWRWLATWPGLCPVCGAWAEGAGCPSCRRQFAAPKARCWRCATPWLAGGVCHRCEDQPPLHVATVAAVDYAFPWNQLLPDLKFHARLELVPWLAGMLVDAVRSAPTPDVGPVERVTAVPLSDTRLRERGFNQAGQIARHVARTLAVPYDDEMLLRWRSTGKQSAMDRAHRLRNLRGAFMPHPLAPARITGRHIALVDDVLTTGATLHAATAALLEGGARAVSLWVVARTPSPQELAQAAESASGDNVRHVPHRPGST